MFTNQPTARGIGFSFEAIASLGKGFTSLPTIRFIPFGKGPKSSTTEKALGYRMPTIPGDGFSTGGEIPAARAVH